MCKYVTIGYLCLLLRRRIIEYSPLFHSATFSHLITYQCVYIVDVVYSCIQQSYEKQLMVAEKVIKTAVITQRSITVSVSITVAVATY